MKTQEGVLEILPPFGRLDNIMGITTDKIKVTLWLLPKSHFIKYLIILLCTEDSISCITQTWEDVVLGIQSFVQ